MTSIPSIPRCPRSGDLLDEQVSAEGRLCEAAQAGRFLDELEWYANASRVARAGGVPY